jgi:hypothetical protein
MSVRGSKLSGNKQHTFHWVSMVTFFAFYYYYRNIIKRCW